MCTLCFSRPCDVNVDCTGGHQCCKECIQLWLKRKSSCPFCRRVVLGIERYPMGTENLPTGSTDSKDECVVTMQFDTFRHAGLTLDNANHASAPAVRVIRLHHEDAAYAAGIRGGDLLLTMNGVPCVEHALCIDLVQAASTIGRPIVLTVVRARHSWKEQSYVWSRTIVRRAVELFS